MTIQPNGNVGIGTTNPGNKLYLKVANDININDGLTIDRGTGANDVGLRLKSDASGNYRGAITYRDAISGVENEIITLGTNSNNSNVGIGTTNPGYKLDVAGTMGITATATALNPILYLDALASPYGGAIVWKRGITNQWNLQTADSGLALYDYSGTAGTRVFFQNGGNVGIGTTEPGAKLDVAGAINSTGLQVNGGGPYVFRNNSASGYASLRLITDQTYGLELDQFGSTFAASDYSQPNGIALININNAPLVLGTNNLARLFIKGDGNIGIGTTSPGYKLQVNGNIGLTSANNAFITSNNASFYSDSNPVAYLDMANEASAGGNAFILRTRNYGGGVYALANRMVITGAIDTANVSFVNSNVGIGTTSPGAKLTLTGDNQYIRVNSAYGSSNGDIRKILFSGDDRWGATTDVVGIQSRIDDAGTNSYALQFLSQLSYNTGAQVHMTIAGSGAISINNLISCGGVQTNGSGTMSCTSDSRLKDIKGAFVQGLDAIMQINPQTYSWKTDSGLYDGGIDYSGFIAQNIETAIPEAVNYNAAGYRQVNTTTILAASINAIKALNLKLEDASSLDTTKTTSLGSLVKKFLGDIGNNVTDLYASVIHSDKVQTKMLCVGTTCVTEDQFLEIVNKSGVATGGQGGNGGGSGDQSNNLTPEQIEAARVAKIATDLATIKTSAGALTEANYTADSWTTFQTALATALALPEDTDANKTDKTTAITSAIAGLQVKEVAQQDPTCTATQTLVDHACVDTAPADPTCTAPQVLVNGACADPS